MKKFLAAVLLSLLAGTAAAQSIDASQIKKKSDGSAAADAVNALKVTIYRSTTAPASPAAGDVWCDTNSTPCAFKLWDGSAWQQGNAGSNASTQVDLTTFPSSPSDGQWFWDKSHKVGWIWDATDSAWYRMDGSGARTATAITDNFTGSTISNPGSGMTIADGGVSGNATSGTHVCAVAFANSTGGETTAGSSATSAVSITASHKITFSSVPTGGAGTTQRRFYCSKAGTSTPRFWVDTLNDNSSTSLTSNVLSDGNMKIYEPDTNYSAALNGAWSVANNTTQTTSGGCGSTGSSVICRISHAGISSSSGVTTDVGVTLSRGISSYNTGNYVIQYRVVRYQAGFGNNYLAGAGGGGGLSTGTSYAGGPLMFQVQNGASNGPLSSTNVMFQTLTSRTTVGGSSANSANFNPFVRITAFPFWIKIVKSGASHNAWISKDAANWTFLLTTGSGTANPTDSALGLVPSSTYDTWWWNTGCNNANCSAGNDLVQELDTFSLTVF